MHSSALPVERRRLHFFNNDNINNDNNDGDVHNNNQNNNDRDFNYNDDSHIYDDHGNGRVRLVWKDASPFGDLRSKCAAQKKAANNIPCT